MVVDHEPRGELTGLQVYRQELTLGLRRSQGRREEVIEFVQMIITGSRWKRGGKKGNIVLGGGLTREDEEAFGQVPKKELDAIAGLVKEGKPVSGQLFLGLIEDPNKSGLVVRSLLAACKEAS